MMIGKAKGGIIGNGDGFCRWAHCKWACKRQRQCCQRFICIGKLLRRIKNGIKIAIFINQISCMIQNLFNASIVKIGGLNKAKMARRYCKPITAGH